MSRVSKTIDLFGKTYVLPPKGLYAGHPGRGPEGKECRHCAHIRRIEMSKTYCKCGLMERYWTGGKGTDIQATAPSCENFKSRAEAA
jgi:hypothetical protein